MRRLSVLTVTVLLLTGAALPPSASAQSPHTHQHSFGNAEKWAQVFDDPDRDAWQKPHEVIQALKLKPDAVIADIGSGTGYFSARFANMTPQGKVYGVDTEPDMVKYLAERAKRQSELAQQENVLRRGFIQDVNHVPVRLGHHKNRGGLAEELGRELLAAVAGDIEPHLFERSDRVGGRAFAVACRDAGRGDPEVPQGTRFRLQGVREERLHHGRTADVGGANGEKESGLRFGHEAWA